MAPPYILLTGPLLVGGFLSYFFLGAFFIQLFTYITEFARNDKKPFLGLVALVAFLEGLQLIFQTHTVYTMLALNYGSDPDTLTNPPWSASSLPTLNGVVALCVQLFFAWRVKLLGKNVPSLCASVLIVLLALAQCGSSVAVTVQFNQLGQTLHNLIIVWLGSTVACDVLMTVSLIVVATSVPLPSRHRRTIWIGLLHTQSRTVALPPSVPALNLIFYLVYPKNYLHICMELIVGRVYANVLMATLNRRDRRTVTGQSAHKTTSNLSMNQGAMPLSSFRPGQHNHNTADRDGKNHGLQTGRSFRVSQAPHPDLYPVVSITTEVHVDKDSSADGESFHQDEKSHVIVSPTP
ncbi:hypothetical protein FA13DRAFT_1797137 [Coprinellus micaceus]|uniref:DUF6534 domain-containing protein n=1 Tax=Coprinellus micaceus TaxID=71717 RepID=A0A4Y7SRV4_COPMI|nr:hypothetical protein FA13DRAFT_1797137 [Coprinellus micaceus]